MQDYLNTYLEEDEEVQGHEVIDFSDPELFVPVYRFLLFCEDRTIILYGSRSSAKTTFALQLKVIKCLSEPYFRCLLVRNKKDAIRASLHSNLIKVIEDWGLQDYFKYSKTPRGNLEVHCVNGNGFYPMGLVENLNSDGNAKGFNNPTDAIVDEAK